MIVNRNSVIFCWEMQLVREVRDSSMIMLFQRSMQFLIHLSGFAFHKKFMSAR